VADRIEDDRAAKPDALDERGVKKRLVVHFIRFYRFPEIVALNLFRVVLVFYLQPLLVAEIFDDLLEDGSQVNHSFVIILAKMLFGLVEIFLVFGVNRHVVFVGLG
jgi:hypothetical protein